MVTFDTDPDHYAHWRMSIDGAVATWFSTSTRTRPTAECKPEQFVRSRRDIELADRCSAALSIGCIAR
jgi:hypothetical protein